MNDIAYTDIEPDSTVKLSGMGNVIFNGVINNGVTMQISGMGNVVIHGKVHDSVRIKYSGMGDLTFSKRPPQQVIDNIKHTGMGSLKIPGGNEKTPSPATIPNGSEKANNKEMLAPVPQPEARSDVQILDNILSKISNGRSLACKIKQSFYENESITTLTFREETTPWRISSKNNIITINTSEHTVTVRGSSFNFNGNKMSIDNNVLTAHDSRIISVKALNAQTNEPVVVLTTTPIKLVPSIDTTSNDKVADLLNFEAESTVNSDQKINTAALSSASILNDPITTSPMDTQDTSQTQLIIPDSNVGNQTIAAENNTETNSDSAVKSNDQHYYKPLQQTSSDNISDNLTPVVSNDFLSCDNNQPSLLTPNEPSSDGSYEAHLNEVNSLISRFDPYLITVKKLRGEHIEHHKNHFDSFIDSITKALNELQSNRDLEQAISTFTTQFNTAVSDVKKALENEPGVWRNLDPIIKGMLGVLAALALIPAVIVSATQQSQGGFYGTFFKKADTAASKAWNQENLDNIPTGESNLTHK